MQTGGGHFAGYDPTQKRVRAPAALGLAAFILLAALLQWRLGHLFVKHIESDPAAGGWADHLALRWSHVRQGEWWRLLFYFLAHHSVWHAGFCALGVYALGRAVEPIIGPVHMLCAAMLGVFAGGLTSCGLGAVAGFSLPGGAEGAWSGSDGPPVQGALPLLATLAGIYSTILPGWRIGAASCWRVRFPVTAGAFGWAVAVGGALWWASGWFPEAGPAPMLGGLGAGWAFARLLGFGGLWFLHPKAKEGPPRSRRVEDMDWEEFLRTELNPVLEKISTHGINSLTRAEWRILQQSRRKLEGW